MFDTDGLRPPVRPVNFPAGRAGFIIVCTCHGLAAGACTNTRAGLPVIFEARINGDYLSVTFDAGFPKRSVEPFDEETAA
jgi:hypothetical protein